MKALEVCRHDLAVDDGCRATELPNDTKNAPGWVWGLPGHLWRRMLVVGFDRQDDVMKAAVDDPLIQRSGRGRGARRAQAATERRLAQASGLILGHLSSAAPPHFLPPAG
jgi:hypothetical protein